MLDRFFVAGCGAGEFMVYQLLDREGTPLYIGQTQDIVRRLKEHEASKPWFSEVASIWIEYADDHNCYRHGVYELERKRIGQLSPRYNKPTRVSKFPVPLVYLGVGLPNDLHQLLRAVAANRGISAQDIARELVHSWAATLTATEIAAALQAQPQPVTA